MAVSGILRENFLTERMDTLVVDLDIRATNRVELQLAGNLLGDFQLVGFFRRQNGAGRYFSGDDGVGRGPIGQIRHGMTICFTSPPGSGR